MNTGIAAARDELRREQRRARQGLGLGAGLRWDPNQAITAGDGLALALGHADAREATYVRAGDSLVSEGFRYDPRLEGLRFARTRALIERAAPGPDEDPRYLEMIARQAASVEMVLRGEYDDDSGPAPAAAALCDRVLLGTIPTLDPGAYAQGLADYRFVLVCAGLIDFLFQAAKAVILALPKVTPAPGAALALSADGAAISAALDADPLPATLLGLTLSAYLFGGLPRSPGAPPMPVERHGPLRVLVNCTERFVLAHEYAHTLHQAWDLCYPGDSAAQEEFVADILALNLTLRSAYDLDGIAPNLAAQGPFFVLAALDCLRRTLHAVRDGAVYADTGQPGHPPLSERAAVLHQTYLDKVSAADDDLSIRAALVPAQTLELLWQRAVGDDLGRWHAGGAPHSIWDGLWV